MPSVFFKEKKLLQNSVQGVPYEFIMNNGISWWFCNIEIQQFNYSLHSFYMGHPVRFLLEIELKVVLFSKHPVLYPVVFLNPLSAK